MAASALLSVLDDVKLREFIPTRPGGTPSLDDAGCKELEKKATMVPRNLKWLVNGHTIHKFNFDYKISMFPAGFIVVADSASAGIVGMVCGAVKDVALHWRSAPARAVYIFDLRVAESHQKAGLGRQLVDRAHGRAQELGATYAYLTVNGDNEKAQMLFLKCGYTECSKRFPLGAKVNPSARTPSGSGNIRVDKIGSDRAIEALRAGLKGRDFTPDDLPSLVQSPFYLGTIVATLGDSSASVSLWDGSGVTTFWISRFLFPAEWYVNSLFRIALVGTGFGVMSAWVLHIYRLFAAGRIGLASGCFVLTAMAAFAVKKFSPLFDFIFMMMRNKEGLMKTRGRLFAPLQHGPQGKECLVAALARAKDELAASGYLAWICNLDVDNSLRDAFDAKGNFIAKLMHKSLDGLEENLPRTSPNDFHDPRDI